MAEEPEKERQAAIKMPQVNINLVAGDDYAYEAKPLPKKPFEPEGQETQAGGMSSQFEIVSAALNKNV